MTTEELQEIKTAAERIHAASVAAGKWDPKPEWEAKLMEIVSDISDAVKYYRGGFHANLEGLDMKMATLPPEQWRAMFAVFVKDTVEDCLADAVIDILDTVEGFGLRYDEDTEEILRALEDCRISADAPFASLGYHLTALTVYHYEPDYMELFCALELLRQWSEAHGIDLRRHVELKMKYNEAGRNVI